MACRRHFAGNDRFTVDAINAMYIHSCRPHVCVRPPQHSVHIYDLRGLDEPYNHNKFYCFIFVRSSVFTLFVPFDLWHGVPTAFAMEMLWSCKNLYWSRTQLAKATSKTRFRFPLLFLVELFLCVRLPSSVSVLPLQSRQTVIY